MRIALIVDDVDEISLAMQIKSQIDEEFLDLGVILHQCVQYPIVRVGVFRILLLGSAFLPNTCQQSVAASEEIVQLEGGSC